MHCVKALKAQGPLITFLINHITCRRGLSDPPPLSLSHRSALLVSLYTLISRLKPYLLLDFIAGGLGAWCSRRLATTHRHTDKIHTCIPAPVSTTDKQDSQNSPPPNTAPRIGRALNITLTATPTIAVLYYQYQTTLNHKATESQGLGHALDLLLVNCLLMLLKGLCGDLGGVYV